MHIRSGALTSSFLFGSVLCVGITPAAAATDDCSTAVIDQTDARVLDVPVIEEAISRLETQGADVRVRAFQVAPSGGLDGYRDSQIAACADWRAPNGDLKGNLLVFAVSLGDEDSAIYYGGNWSDELLSEIDDIRSDVMNPPFEDGDFTEGMVAAIVETDDVISGETVDAREVSNGVIKVIVTIALIVLAVFVAIGLVAYVNTRRRKAKQKCDARDNAMLAKSSADEAYLQLQALWGRGVTPKLSLVTAGLPDQWVRELSVEATRVERTVRTALENKEEMEADPARFDLERDRSTMEYEAIAARYYGVTRALRSAHVQLDGFVGQLDTLQPLKARDRVWKLEEPQRQAKAAEMAAAVRNRSREAARREQEAVHRKAASQADRRGSSSSRTSSDTRGSSSGSDTTSGFTSGWAGGYVSGGSDYSGGSSGGYSGGDSGGSSGSY